MLWSQQYGDSTRMGSILGQINSCLVPNFAFFSLFVKYLLFVNSCTCDKSISCNKCLSSDFFCVKHFYWCVFWGVKWSSYCWPNCSTLQPPLGGAWKLTSGSYAPYWQSPPSQQTSSSMSFTGYWGDLRKYILWPACQNKTQWRQLKPLTTRFV